MSQQQNGPTLGQLIQGVAYRDAVHVAVAPAVAAHRLEPGDHVGLLPDGRVGRVAVPFAIIDPFLAGAVEEGQQCWICLYPNTVTSLRHAWTHPSFQVKPPEIRHGS